MGLLKILEIAISGLVIFTILNSGVKQTDALHVPLSLENSAVKSDLEYKNVLKQIVTELESNSETGVLSKRYPRQEDDDEDAPAVAGPPVFPGVANIILGVLTGDARRIIEDGAFSFIGDKTIKSQVFQIFHNLLGRTTQAPTTTQNPNRVKTSTTSKPSTSTTQEPDEVEETDPTTPIPPTPTTNSSSVSNKSKDTNTLGVQNSTEQSKSQSVTSGRPRYRRRTTTTTTYAPIEDEDIEDVLVVVSTSPRSRYRLRRTTTTTTTPAPEDDEDLISRFEQSLLPYLPVNPQDAVITELPTLLK